MNNSLDELLAIAREKVTDALGSTGTDGLSAVVGVISPDNVADLLESNISPDFLYAPASIHRLAIIYQAYMTAVSDVERTGKVLTTKSTLAKLRQSESSITLKVKKIENEIVTLFAPIDESAKQRGRNDPDLMNATSSDLNWDNFITSYDPGLEANLKLGATRIVAMMEIYSPAFNTKEKPGNVDYFAPTLINAVRITKTSRPVMKALRYARHMLADDESRVHQGIESLIPPARRHLERRVWELSMNYFDIIAHNVVLKKDRYLALQGVDEKLAEAYGGFGMDAVSISPKKDFTYAEALQFWKLDDQLYGEVLSRIDVKPKSKLRAIPAPKQPIIQPVVEREYESVETSALRKLFVERNGFSQDNILRLGYFLDENLPNSGLSLEDQSKIVSRLGDFARMLRDGNIPLTKDDMQMRNFFDDVYISALKGKVPDKDDGLKRIYQAAK